MNSVYRNVIAFFGVVILLGVLVNPIALAQGEIRVFPVPTGVGCNGTAGFAPAGTTACDLVRVAAGFPATTGPDAGKFPSPGVTIVVATGTYFLATSAPAVGLGHPFNGTGPVLVPGAVFNSGLIAGNPTTQVMTSVEIRSRSGSAVTVIDGSLAINNGSDNPCVILAADNVTFGGRNPDQGFTLRDCDEDGLTIGQPDDAAPAAYPPPPGAGTIDVTGGTGGDEDMTVQNNFVVNADGDCIIAQFPGTTGPRPIENFLIYKNTGRNCDGDGLHVDQTVSTVGGTTEDEQFRALENTFDSNSSDGIEFENAGPQERVVVGKNYLVRNCNNGAYWDRRVQQIEDIHVYGNLIKENGVGPRASANPQFVCPARAVRFGAGIAIAASGNVERLYIQDNRNDDFDEGISGNAGSGIVFVSRPAFVVFFIGGLPVNGVQNLDEVYISGNVINDNGDVMATTAMPAAGLSTVLNAPFDGVTILNAGTIERLYVQYNKIYQNAGSGFSIGLPGNALTAMAPPGRFPGYAVPGDFQDSVIEGNYIWNNGRGVLAPLPVPLVVPGGRILPHGDGFAAFIRNNVDNITFRENEVSENLNNGVFLSSSTSDINNPQFFDNYFNDNGSQATPPTTGVAGFPTGDGLELSSFDDITGFLWQGGQANGNGGSGINLDALNNTLASLAYGAGTLLVGGAPPLVAANASALVAINRADTADVNIRQAEFHFNGASAPIGAGNGIVSTSEKLDDVNIEDVSGNQNDDHGTLLSVLDDMNNINLSNVELHNNDNNNDSIGAGVFLDSTEDMVDVILNNVMANGNFSGAFFDIRGENGGDIGIENSFFSDNKHAGIGIRATDDLRGLNITGTTSSCNTIQLLLDVVDIGQDLIIDNNHFLGCSGTGIVLDASGATITNNNIRDNDIGIEVIRSEDNHINQNNIARNKMYGIDTTGLPANEDIDATENWWGEPSGPEHDSNPGGFGDEVTDNVIFDPWLGEPNGETLSEFEITSFDVADTANVGEEVVFSARIENAGSEEGVSIVSFKVFNSDGDLVNSSSRSIVLDPAGSTSVDFGFTFQQGGTYTVEVSAGGDTQTSTIEVLGATGVSIESVCDANNNNRIDDDEIVTCVGFWVTGEEVPGTGEFISDAKIKFLIELWVTNGDITSLEV